MLTKKDVLLQVDTFPEKFSLDELVEKLIIIDKIEKGIQQIENGETISHQQVKQISGKWFK